MSCGTCPDSAQPTTRADGMAPTHGQLLWSKDVGAWYRQQRARGGQPVITMPATAVPAASEPPPPAAPWIGLSAERVAQLHYGKALNAALRYGLSAPGDVPSYHKGHPLVGDGALLSLHCADEAVCYSYPAKGGGTALALVYRMGAHSYRVAVDDADHPHRVQWSGAQWHGPQKGRGSGVSAVTAAQEAMAKLRQRRGSRVMFFCVRCGVYSTAPWGPEPLCESCRRQGHTLKNLTWGE